MDGGIFGSLGERIQRMMGMPVPLEVEVRGFRVAVENTRPDVNTEDVLERFSEALALVAEYQPWRLRHMQRDLRRFVIARFPSRGAYFPADRSCLTELTFLARRDITAAPVAASMIHEGMHARVDAWRRRHGSRPTEPDRAREERLCRKAELAFGRALPPHLGAPVVERALASLSLSDDEVAPTIDWRVARARQNEVDRKATE